MDWWAWLLVVVAIVVAAVVVHDLTQREHAILRNFPILGHFRYLLEGVGPELRQYIVVDNDAEKPFSRDQRRWVYSAAKGENTYFGFGTDNDLDTTPGYLIVKHSTFPARTPLPADADYDPGYRLPAAKTAGAARGRSKAFRFPSAVNISSMSYGSLGARAIEGLNRGALEAGCLHGTGEGGISPYHAHGADLVWQIGTGYFGCRDGHGRFDLARFRGVVDAHPEVRMVEIKLSQGAKPGLGGLLPSSKVTPEVARLRGIPEGVDCWSPTAHSAFSDADSLLDFAETLAEASGLPIAIKSAVGDIDFFADLARLMARDDRGVDVIVVDGGEGGTGAGPLVFADHVALPFKVGFSRVYRAFAQLGIQDQVVFTGSGKLGLPDNALLAFALGCDSINVGREAMLAIGCIQAQRCHTGRCPTGVATNSEWLQRGLVPEVKAERVARYVTHLRKELLSLAQACGVPHPALVGLDHLEFLDGRLGTTPARDAFGYLAAWGLPGLEDQATVRTLMGQPVDE